MLQYITYYHEFSSSRSNFSCCQSPWFRL